MSPVMERTKTLAGRLGMGEDKFAVCEYDFAVDGGVAGSIALRGDKVPSGAIVIDSLLYIDTALSGGTVTDTLAVTVESAGDVATASARNAAPWSTTGAKRGSMTATTAPILTTA